MKIFENICEMLIESRMTYGFEVWGLVEWGGIKKIGSTFGNYLDIGQGLVGTAVAQWLRCCATNR